MWARSLSIIDQYRAHCIGVIPLGNMVVFSYGNPPKKLKAEVYRWEVQDELFILTRESG